MPTNVFLGPHHTGCGGVGGEGGTGWQTVTFVGWCEAVQPCGRDGQSSTDHHRTGGGGGMV